jgi:hypothetical protein
MNYNSNFRNPTKQVLPDGTVISLDQEELSISISESHQVGSSLESVTQNNPMDNTAVGFDIS